MMDVLSFPSTIFMKRVVFYEAELQLAKVDDCALTDLPGEQELHTFDGGKSVSFTKKQ